MEGVTVQHPISVKVVVTEAFRSQIIAEARASIQKIDANIEMLAEVTPEGEADDASDPREVEFHRARLEAERQKLYQMRKELDWRIREAEEIKEGAELPFQTIQGTTQLKVGDDYLATVTTEIVLKDWKVTEIRRA